MFAIVRTGGKQYRVAAGDKIVVDRMDGEAGSRVALGDVLFTSEGSAKGLTVAAEIIAQAKADKIIVFKKKRRHNYRRRNGHRQQHTILKIISVGGEVAPKAAAKAAKPAKADEAPGAPAVDASNLSLISGVGPAIEKKLRAAGITSWNDIAAWSADDIAKWDVELKLSGRATKEEWVDQAKELLAGKAPRAKVDQAEKASGKDK